MDEVLTLKRSTPSFWKIAADSLANHHFPLYFWLLHPIVQITHSEALVRLPSALFSAIACAVVTAAGNRVSGLPAGVSAGLLIASSPLQIQYGQEARPNALASLWIVLALYALLDIGTRLQQDGKPRTTYLSYLFAGSTLLSLLTLGIGWIWLITSLILIFSIGFSKPKCYPKQAIATRLGSYAVCTLIVATAALIPMYIFVTAKGNLTEGLLWVPEVSGDRFWTVISSVLFSHTRSAFSFRDYTVLATVQDVTLFIISVSGSVSLWKSKRIHFWLLILCTIFPLGLTIFLSPFWSLWLERYLLWIEAPFALLCGLGWASLPKIVRWLVGALILLSIVVNLQQLATVELKPRWDLAASIVSSGVTNGNYFLVPNTWVPRMLNEYLERQQLYMGADQWTCDPKKASKMIEEGHPVWSIFGRVGLYDVEASSHFAARTFFLGPPTRVWPVGRDIVVSYFKGSPNFLGLAEEGACPN